MKVGKKRKKGIDKAQNKVALGPNALSDHAVAGSENCQSLLQWMYEFMTSTTRYWFHFKSFTDGGKGELWTTTPPTMSAMMSAMVSDKANGVGNDVSNPALEKRASQERG